jgi:raffinose/stachyose/melibiose transport system permease protein
VALFRYTWRTFARELGLLAAAILFFIPPYFLVTLSFKNQSDSFLKPTSFPTDPEFSNYSAAWEGGANVDLAHGMLNSAIITLGSIAGLILFGSLCAWTLARRPSKLSSFMYFVFVLGIIIPIQLGVVPLYVVVKELHLMPSHFGMILLNFGLLMPLTVFLYTGFVRALPRDYEEAAQVDGAGLTRTFVRVVFPLLRPVTGTVAVLTGVFTWNEFFLPLIFLNGTDYETLPVALYSFVGLYEARWNFVFAGVVLAIAPVLAFYLLAQRQLIRGFTGGVRG